MAIGRISGPLLKANLLRQGVDLAFENDLIYLSLTNEQQPATHMVGIKTDSPAYTLDVDGTVNARVLLRGEELLVNDINIDNNLIKSLNGQDLVVQADTLRHVKINSNTDINGNLYVSGNITADGSLFLGDQNTDNVVFNADINSDFLPNIDLNYNLGSVTKRWLALYADTVNIKDLNFTGEITNDIISIHDNIVEIVQDNTDLIVRTASSGIVKVESNTRITGTLEVDSATTLNSTLYVNNNTTLNSNLAVNGGDLTTNASTFNLLNTNATTVNAFGAATDIQIGAATGTTNINNDLDVDGDVNIDGGDLTTSASTFNLLNTTATTVNAFGAATDIQIGATTGTTNINNDLDVDGDVNIDGGDLTVSATTFNLANTTATTVNAFGAATTIEIGASTGTTNINNDLDVDGDVNIDGGDLTVSATTFNLANTTATTVNAFGAATTLEIGASTGTTNINNNLDVDLDLNVDGGDITTSATTFNLINTTATTVNAFGAATTVEIGATTGTTNINNDLDVDGDVNIDGDDLTTSASIFNLLNTNATTVNAFGAATDIQIGAATGTTSVNNNLTVDLTLDVDGQTTLASLNVEDLTEGRVIFVGASGELVDSSKLVFDSATSKLTITGDTEITGNVFIGGNITIGDVTTDSITVVADFTSNLIPDDDSTYNLGSINQKWKNLYADTLNASEFNNGNIRIVSNRIETVQLDQNLEINTNGVGKVIINNTSSIVIPVGDTAERPLPAQAGEVRFNTDTERVENYNGSEWNRMLHDDDAIAYAIALG